MSNRWSLELKQSKKNPQEKNLNDLELSDPKIKTKIKSDRWSIDWIRCWWGDEVEIFFAFVHLFFC